MAHYQEPSTVDTIHSFLGLRVLVVGDVILDTYINGTADRICREAPVPVVTKQSEQVRLGGAANMAANIAALGAEVTFVGLVGEDVAASELRSAMHASGISDQWIVSDAGVTTVHTHRVIADDQYVVRIDEGKLTVCSSASRAAMLDRVERLFSRSDLVILSDHGYGTISDEIVTRLRSLREERRCVMAIDATDVGRYTQAGATVIIPSVDEALMAAHLEAEATECEPDGIDRALREKVDAKLVAATLASGEMLLVDSRGQTTRLPANPVKRPSGVVAKASFAGAMAMALAAGASGRLAAQIGIDAVGIASAKRDTPVVTHRELLRRVSVSHGPYGRLSVKEIAASLEGERHAGRRIVFTNGVFDILHAGHVELLRRAKELGDVLVVGVNSDASVRRLKGENRPINREQDRLAIVAALDAVDYALIFTEDSPADTIRHLRPDVHVKGGDYTAESLPEIGAVREVGAQIRILSLVDGLSTTNVINHILAQRANDLVEHLA